MSGQEVLPNNIFDRNIRPDRWYAFARGDWSMRPFSRPLEGDGVLMVLARGTKIGGGSLFFSF